MLQNIRNTLKHSAVYSIGNIANKLVGFILLPLYATHLTIAEYGMWALLEATSQILIMVGGFRLHTAMMRWLADTDDPREQKSINATVLFSTLVIVGLIGLLGYTLRTFLSRAILDSAQFVPYINYMFLMIILSIYNQIPMQLLRFHEKSIQFVFISLLRLLTTLTVTLVTILHFDMTVDGVLIGQICGMTVTTLLTLPFVLMRIRLTFHYALLKEMAEYSFPLIFATLSAMLLNLGDRYILKYFADFADVGQYSLAYKIASVINVFVIQSFQMGYLPIAFKMCNKPESRRFFSKIFLYFEMTLIFMVLGLSVFAKDLIDIITDNPNYIKAHLLVPIIAMVFISKGLHYIFSIGLHCAKKNKYNIIAVTVGALVNLGLNIIFIPYWGKTAAAITSVISGFLVAAIYYHYSNRHYPVPYEIKKLLLMLIIAGGLFAFSLLPVSDSLFILWPYKLFLVLLFPFLLYPFNFYEPIELLRIRQSWQKWRNPLRWKKNFIKK
jgi:O-antigen/teichoic acid export membrane protein